MAKKIPDTAAPDTAAPSKPIVTAPPVNEGDGDDLSEFDRLTHETWKQYTPEQRKLLYDIGLWDGESALGTPDEIKIIARGFQTAAEVRRAENYAMNERVSLKFEGSERAFAATLGRLASQGRQGELRRRPDPTPFGVDFNNEIDDMIRNARDMQFRTVTHDDGDPRGIVAVIDGDVILHGSLAAFGATVNGEPISLGELLKRLAAEPIVAVAPIEEPKGKGRKPLSDDAAATARARAKRYREEKKERQDAEVKYAIVVAGAKAKGEEPPPPPEILTKPKGKGGRKPKAQPAEPAVAPAVAETPAPAAAPAADAGF